MTEVIRSRPAAGEGLPLDGDETAQPFQIFPDPCDSPAGEAELKEPLPLIVVELTDGAEVESGELRWPPEETLTPDTGPARPGPRGQADAAGEELPPGRVSDT